MFTEGSMFKFQDEKSTDQIKSRGATTPQVALNKRLKTISAHRDHRYKIVSG